MPQPDHVVERLNAALKGRYRIERKLGEGGMATVYLADDLRHERKVALKVLKPELAAVVGGERFLAEIKTTANLQHPHILPLFDSGEAGSFLFYVMPYVEGESLRARLDREHQLPVEEAVRIAKSVAEALGYAHGHGVIHRDIKPANILLHAGEPIVSDFGIALALGVAGAGRLTETGLSLGTPHYMSPEQATGDLSVGAATDIYAVGCVLYEMLVGEPPYTGSTPQAILGKIITGDLESATKHRRSIPANVDAALMKALERVPADRFTSAKDFADALSNPSFRHAGMVVAASTSSAAPWKRATVALAAVSLGLAALGAWALLGAGGGVVGANEMVAWSLTAPPEIEIDPNWGLAISPDERTIVFVDWQSRQLYRRDFGRVEVAPIPGTESPWKPFFSPDGASIAFFDDTENLLKRVDLDGSGSITLGPVPPTGRSGRWAEDGTIVFNSSGLGGLSRVAETGGEMAFMARSVGSISWFDLLPGGRTVVGAKAGGTELVAVDLETGSEAPLFPGVSPRYVQTRDGGYLLYGREGDLWVVPFDSDRLETLGAPRLLAQEVRGADANRLIFDATENVLVYWPDASARDNRLVWVDREGNRTPIAVRPGRISRPRLSPEGRRVAYVRGDDGNRDIWVVDLVSGTETRITFHPARDVGPVWSPDGQRLAFSSGRDGAENLYWRAADGSDAVERLTESPSDQRAYGWTPDGSLLYSQEGDVWSVPPRPGAEPVALMQEDYRLAYPQISPNGRFILLQSYELGYPEIWVRSFPDLRGSWMVSTLDIGPYSGIANADPREGRTPVWSPHGNEIYYMSGYGTLVRVPVGTAGALAPGQPDVFLEGDWTGPSDGPHYDVSPDGERFLMTELAPLREVASELVVIQNWRELLDDGGG